MATKLAGSRDDLPSPDFSFQTGRFTDADFTALGQLIQWWRWRLDRDADSNPMQSMIAGVTYRGTATTVSLAAGNVTLTPPLAETVNTAGSYLVHAYGVPTYIAGGAVFSLLGLAHFHYATGVGWITNYSTISRIPASESSTSILASLTPAGVPKLSVTGVTGLTINWTIHVYKLET